MLSISNASLSSGKIRRVDNMSLNCDPGCITALLGPNGAGKTSTLKLLSGEMNADSGEVMLNQRVLPNWRPKDRAKMLAMLPQQSTLNFPFTVEEVVLMGRIPYDTGVRQDRKISRQTLHAVDSWQLANRNYVELSGGEKQRVQLARVLAQIWQPAVIDGEEQHRVLLLDEPAASLDIAHQQLLMTIVHELAQQNVVIVIVVHDLNIALQNADQLVLMSQGQMVAKGRPSDITKGSLLQSVFGVELDFMVHPKSGKSVAILD